MQKFEIWLGSYHLGQGYHPPCQPELIAIIYSINFKLACYEYEVRQRLESIHRDKANGKEDIHTYVDYYDPINMSNSWTGKYYPTREEALKSFQ